MHLNNAKAFMDLFMYVALSRDVTKVSSAAVADAAYARAISPTTSASTTHAELG